MNTMSLFSLFNISDYLLHWHIQKKRLISGKMNICKGLCKKGVPTLVPTCQQFKLRFSAPKMSDFFIPNWGRWLTRTKQFIVGKGGHSPPPLSTIPPFLEIQDVPTFHRSISKAKVLNNSCNQSVYSSYPQSILILEEYLQNGEIQTWYNACKCFLVTFMKRGCQLEKGICYEIVIRNCHLHS